MNKGLQAKIKHHHVWDYYIRRWSDNARDVWHTTKSRKISYDSAKGLAREDNFYQILPLSQSHIDYIKNMSLMSPKGLHDLHMLFLGDILKLQYAENQYSLSGRKNEEIEQHIYVLKCNVLENMHTTIESQARNVLDELAMRNFSILSSLENMMIFCNYLGHQISRTKTFKDNLFSNREYVENNEAANIMEECWWFLSYMFGMNIGCSIFLSRNNDSHCLLINDTDMPFITSDQPIINAYQFPSEDIKPPEDNECDFYYPISPTIAYMVSSSNRFSNGSVQVTLELVEEMNVKMAKRANIHLFGNTKESLKPFVKHIANHKEKCELFYNKKLQSSD
ncbi:DUF4238 domain-containing protein [Aeromonas caviae]|uniref:DUF4238 domain-containing protein n=1 Tax=Aeromonas caviae TaxID=648 RepID=UPI00191F5F09|nr:DUF4238 domain-containing protein [Aeromonas caviae]